MDHERLSIMLVVNIVNSLSIDILARSGVQSGLAVLVAFFCLFLRMYRFLVTFADVGSASLSSWT